MIYTIRVTTTIGPDLQAQSVLSELKHASNQNGIKNIQAARVYRLEGITEKQAKLLAEKLLSESINQRYIINKPIRTNHSYSSNKVRSSSLKTASSSHSSIKNSNNNFLHIIEIAYKPGVMNPEVASIIKAAADLGITLTAADSSWEYGFFGKLSKEEAQKLVTKLKLYNPTVEHIVENTPSTLLIKGKPGPTTIIPLRDMTDDDLLALSKDKLFLNLQEMKVIQSYFQKIKRDPTDCELETIAQTWSEHCAHKTFKAKLIVDGKEKEPLMKRIKKEALKHKKNIVSAFVDNSGVMEFYDGFSICAKVETHNSPSAIEPYGGAMTGSGGVFRDVLGTGQGAKPIVSTDMFCFAPFDMSLDKLPSGCLPPLYLLKHVIRGVKDYGNRMGIPTNNGSVHFHDDFRAKPTVIVGCYGLIPTKKAQKGEPKPGDVVVAVGGRTGRDGIHGATFSSAEMTDRTINVNSSAVQIGNAIEEKRMCDAILEARDQNVIRAMQDLGAGGFSSAIGEMGIETGVEVHLEKALVKYEGLSPWEIWVSESQERMALAIPKNKLKKFLDICNKYNVETAVLGKFTKNKKLHVYFDKQLICDLDMAFLHDGLPQRVMIARKPIQLSSWSEVKRSDRISSKKSRDAISFSSFQHDNKITQPKSQQEWSTAIKKVLSHGNVCSKEPIVRRYDHTVQGTNALQPFSGELLDGPNNASVVRPILNKKYGMIVSHGLNPVLNNTDPYWGSIWAITEALSNYVAAGGNYKHASLINNYIWPFPDEESLWSLDKSVDAVVDAMKLLKIPVISGKDSLSSTYRGKDGTIIKIPPVLCMSVFGKIKDVGKTMSSDFKKENSLVYLVGKMDFEAMGGSTYYQVCHSEAKPKNLEILRYAQDDNQIPHVDLKTLPKTLDAVYKAINKQKVLTVHDISEGGLLTAIFEMCVGGNMGVSINLNVIARNAKQSPYDNILFNETAGCFVVEVANEKIAKTLFKNIPHILLGSTQKEPTITITQDKNNLFSIGVHALKQSWQKPLKEIFG